jgi:site-specific recombinase XerD
MYFNDFLDDYFSILITEKNASNFTLTSYQTDFKIFLKFLDKNGIPQKLSNISTTLLRRYFVHLRCDCGYKNSTIRRKMHSLSSYFNYLCSEKIIEENPMKKINIPKKDFRIPKYLKQDEIKKLLTLPSKLSNDDFYSKRNLAIMLTFLHGARRAEAINLKWKDIDLSSKVITIRDTKSKHDRIIPMSSQFVDAIWDYLNFILPITNEYVLITKKGNNVAISPISSIFKRYFQELDSDNEYTIHTLRHTFATYLALGDRENNVNGANVFEIALLLGHNNIESSQIYCHTHINELRYNISKLPY